MINPLLNIWCSLLFGYTRQYRMTKSLKIAELYKNPDIVKQIKAQRFGWVRHIAMQQDREIVKLAWKAISAKKKKTTWVLTNEMEGQHHSRS